MDSEQFHSRITAICKDHFARWDHGHNPLDWPNAPQDLLDLVVEVVAEAFDDPRSKAAGAPLILSYGTFENKVHTPPTEANFKVEILPLSDCEEYAKASVNLADSIIAYAEGGDEGWIVDQAVLSLQGTIKRIQAEAVKRGWEIDQAD